MTREECVEEVPLTILAFVLDGASVDASCVVDPYLFEPCSCSNYDDFYYCCYNRLPGNKVPRGGLEMNSR